MERHHHFTDSEECEDRTGGRRRGSKGLGEEPGGMSWEGKKET